MELTNEFEPIRNWAQERGIFEKGDSKTQLGKLMEEVGELAKAILKNDEEEMVDAIGDCVVVLTNLCVLCNLKKESKKDIREIQQITIEDCINTAFNVIKNRKGKMENGTFKKETV
jgi:NTP pyrophosphatase (non-canonical NTP hydrolase)